jgi:hypothetical protein
VEENKCFQSDTRPANTILCGISERYGRGLRPAFIYQSGILRGSNGWYRVCGPTSGMVVEQDLGAGSFWQLWRDETGAKMDSSHSGRELKIVA